MEPVGSATRFRLAPGTRLETFADGTAILFSAQLDETLSLNATAALLCGHADGGYALGDVLEAIRDLFPEADVSLDEFASLVQELLNRGFLVRALID